MTDTPMHQRGKTALVDSMSPFARRFLRNEFDSYRFRDQLVAWLNEAHVEQLDHLAERLVNSSFSRRGAA